MAELDHELANVVNGLLGMARLVRESGLNAEQDSWLEAIEHSGRQLGRLVGAYRRGGASPMRSHASHFDGIRLLDQVLISHSPAARAEGNHLSLIVSPELSRHWFADPRLLRQLLDNLLGNAARVTRSGSILVEADADAAASGPRATLVLRVSDSGPGVDEALGDRMFEAYRQGPEATRGGSGLGLFICRRIAAAMGGSIGWTNPESGGACFELRAPEVVVTERADALPTPRLLRSLHCRLRLTDHALRSVAAILDRIGVRWSVEGHGSVEGNLLAIEIGPAPSGALDPGPNLALRIAQGRSGNAPVRILRGPILESRLGPLLLQMALEALSAPGAEKG